MKKDHFRENDALDKGRKKVYHLKEGNIELLNPKDGSLVDYLQKGDLVYYISTVEDGGEKMLVFRAMKFAGKKNQNTHFKAKKSLFEKHYTEDKNGKSNVDGDGKESVVKDDKKGTKTNVVAPVIIGLGIGAASFFIAKKYNKNVWIFGTVGLAIGLGLGHLIVNKGLTLKMKK